MKYVCLIMLGKRMKDSFSVFDSFNAKLKDDFSLVYDYTDRVNVFKPLKQYNSLNDKIFYSFGDSLEYNTKGELLLIDRKHEKDYRDIGFRKVQEEISYKDTITYSVRLTLPFPDCTLIGIDYNSRVLAQSRGIRFDTTDLFRPEMTGDPVENFNSYCELRWKVALPPSLLDVIDELYRLYKSNYKFKFYEIKFDVKSSSDLRSDSDLRKRSMFERMMVGYENYRLVSRGKPFNSLSVECSGNEIISPSLSTSIVNGRKKNKTIIDGFMYNYDYYYLIGESPGEYYNDYSNYINKHNCYVYDPRDIAFSNHATHYKRMFGYGDINVLSQFSQSNSGKRILVRIDIRSDKPANASGVYNEEWELSVHSDNCLIVALINAMPDNVTILAKFRPSYSNKDYNATPLILKNVILLPEPYLRHSTAEMTIFVPAKFLGYTDIDTLQGKYITYNIVDKYSCYICALKKVIGRAYDAYLVDLYTWCNIMVPKSNSYKNAIGIFSVSNRSELSDDFNTIATSFSNSAITYPYGNIVTEFNIFISRGRVYEDKTIRVIDEVDALRNLYIIPIYHYAPGKHITLIDLSTVVLTDRMDSIKFDQRRGVVSTQIVKLVSFTLKAVFSKKALDWKVVDDNCRLQVLNQFALLMDKSPNTVIVDAKRIGCYVNGNLISVSGHMIYIVLGSILGIPYGLRKYLREIENNISSISTSFEGNKGTLIWHSYISHVLALRCVKLMIGYICSCSFEDMMMVDKVLEFMSYELTVLATKYPEYLISDEYMRFR